MGIPVNIEDSTLARPVIERVREEAVRTNSVDAKRVLHSRFKFLPVDLAGKLERLRQHELNQVLDHAGTADAAEAALTIAAPSIRP